VLRSEALQAVLAEQKEASNKGKLLGEMLIDGGFCNEDQICEALAIEYDVPYAKLEQRLYDPEVVDILPREFLEKNLVVPLFLVENVLTVAVTDCWETAR